MGNNRFNMASYSITERDIKIAQENWENWKSIFEYEGPAAANPLLADSSKFGAFLNEYKVHRTIRSGTSDKLRIMLGGPEFELQTLLSDTSGKLLDAREFALRAQFGTLSGKRGIRSAMSKIVSFLAPHAFVAWDEYARKGLNMVLGRSPSSTFANYAEYIGYLNQVLSSDIGKCVRSACADRYPTQYASKRDRFNRRVLDVSLMRLGNRDF
jgi:hypothetical protein